ncbi:MAG: right-handed parallel beta-helix repeat-containing protein, partial [bacterium]
VRMKKKTQFILIGLMLGMLVSPLVFAQNAITATAISSHATFHNVGVQVDYTGDANLNASAVLEANIAGAGFKTVHPLSRVNNTRFVGTVFSVPPQTSVEVRVTLVDPDGVMGGVQTASITTRSEQTPVSTGTEIHVAKTGSDSTGDGSAANPFGSIQHAFDLSTAGSQIMIHAGSYHQALVTDLGPTGTISDPITITNAGDGTVLFDGSDPGLRNPDQWASEGGAIYSAPVINTFYVGVDGHRLFKYASLADLQNLIYSTNGGFYMDTAAQKVYLRLPDDNAPNGHLIEVSTLRSAFDLSHTSDVVIKGLNIKNYNLSRHSGGISLSDGCARIWVENNRFEQMETGVRLEALVVDTVVMNNEFSDQGVNAFDWNTVKDFQDWLEHGALFVTNDDYFGYGTIFYKNSIHDFFDGVKIVGLVTLNYASNSDVEDNVFYHLSDDGVETDGYSSNVRIVNNRFENLLAGVSVAPAEAGPTYLVRNLMVDLNNVAFTDYETNAIKFNIDGELSGDVFAYHNTGMTFEANQAALSMSNSSNWQHLTVLNNIWYGTEYAFYWFLDNTAVLAPNTIIDNNTMFSNSGFLAQFQGEDYADVPDLFQVSGFCAQCDESDPLFVDAASGDYNLMPISPAIDQAVLIPGINDTGFTGVAADNGALEFGQSEQLFVDGFE